MTSSPCACTTRRSLELTTAFPRADRLHELSLSFFNSPSPGAQFEHGIIGQIPPPSSFSWRGKDRPSQDLPRNQRHSFMLTTKPIHPSPSITQAQAVVDSMNPARRHESGLCSIGTWSMEDSSIRSAKRQRTISIPTSSMWTPIPRLKNSLIKPFFLPLSNLPVYLNHIQLL